MFLLARTTPAALAFSSHSSMFLSPDLCDHQPLCYRQENLFYSRVLFDLTHSVAVRDVFTLVRRRLLSSYSCSVKRQRGGLPCPQCKIPFSRKRCAQPTSTRHISAIFKAPGAPSAAGIRHGASPGSSGSSRCW